jgi:hypothetical protein
MLAFKRSKTTSEAKNKESPAEKAKRKANKAEVLHYWALNK